MKTDPCPKGLCISNFELQYIIGRGGFGVVWRAKMKKSGKLFALKHMSKLRIVQKESIKSVLNERMLLSIIKHPFIVNMQYAFQDRLGLYLVMDLMIGGDLRYHMNKKKTFNEPQTKFIVSCILTGLEYLHVNGILHRDIKPENLVFDNKGYLRITDFGVANLLKKNNGNDSSGTPGYMSPEVMNRLPHGFQSDYYAIGVIAFECMCGRRPYFGRNRKEIKDQILSKQVQLKKNNVPAGWTLESADFINKLLVRNPAERLGSNGPQELKNHMWLSGVEWKKLLEKTIEAPYKFTSEDNFDAKVIQDWNDQVDDTIDLDFIQNFFAGYHFDSSVCSIGLEGTLPRFPRTN